jgi:hypothetical protein
MYIEAEYIISNLTDKKPITSKAYHKLRKVQIFLDKNNLNYQMGSDGNTVQILIEDTFPIKLLISQYGGEDKLQYFSEEQQG